jgi:pentatricopeptide repeat protein
MTADVIDLQSRLAQREAVIVAKARMLVSICAEDGKLEKAKRLLVEMEAFNG